MTEQTTEQITLTGDVRERLDAWLQKKQQCEFCPEPAIGVYLVEHPDTDEWSVLPLCADEAHILDGVLILGSGEA